VSKVRLRITEDRIEGKSQNEPGFQIRVELESFTVVHRLILPLMMGWQEKNRKWELEWGEKKSRGGTPGRAGNVEVDTAQNEDFVCWVCVGVGEKRDVMQGGVGGKKIYA